MEKGLFITFEGMDGGGKTTQIIMLEKYLLSKGYKVVRTREPGGTEIGDKIRHILLDKEHHLMCARTEALLYAAARAQHVEQLIIPALKNGKIVLSDRYADSTAVYQGIARNLPEQSIDFMIDFATSGVQPDLTFVLECELETVAKRVGARGAQDRIEMEGLAFQELVKKGYRKIAEKCSKRKMKFINAEESVSDVHREIVKHYETFIRGSGL